MSKDKSIFTKFSDQSSLEINVNKNSRRISKRILFDKKRTKNIVSNYHKTRDIIKKDSEINKNIVINKNKHKRRYKIVNTTTTWSNYNKRGNKKLTYTKTQPSRNALAIKFKYKKFYRKYKKGSYIPYNLPRRIRVLKFRFYWRSHRLKKAYWVTAISILMSRLKKFNFVKRIFYLTLKRVKRNMFVNISNLSGAVLKKISAGMFFKRTVRKTFFATDVTLKKAFVLFKQTKSLQNAIVFMNIYGNVHKKGYKKNIKTLLHSRGFSLASLNILDMRAHNGVRKPKRRRK